MIRTISDLWDGRKTLPRAFWVFAIGYGTLLNLVTTFASLAALSAGASGLAVIAIHFAPLPYNILATVGVWRSAKAYRGSAVWKQLAQIAVAVWAVIVSIV